MPVKGNEENLSPASGDVLRFSVLLPHWQRKLEKFGQQQAILLYSYLAPRYFCSSGDVLIVYTVTTSTKGQKS